jgi:hypothetical protein
MAKKSYKNKVKYEIDLIKVLNRLDKPSAVKDKLRGLMRSRLFKQKFGERVIDRIAHRTEKKRIDKKNKPFLAPYSTMYQQSDEFKIYNKSKSIVNLKLTGEMLASMRLGKAGGTRIRVQMADEDNAAKAHGHINGIKRRVNQRAKVKTKRGKVIRPRTKKIKRDFFGLPKEDEAKILNETIRQFNRETIENLIDFERDTLDLSLQFSTIATQTTTETAQTGIEVGSAVDTSPLVTLTDN